MAQGAWFVLLKYPAYCDSLSLCNGVAEIHGMVAVLHWIVMLSRTNLQLCRPLQACRKADTHKLCNN